MKLTPVFLLDYDEMFALAEIAKFSPKRRTKKDNAVEAKVWDWLDSFTWDSNAKRYVAK